MNKMDLIHAYKSMLMVAREYNLELDEKYEELDDEIEGNYDLSVDDMMGSLEKGYQLLNNN